MRAHVGGGLGGGGVGGAEGGGGVSGGKGNEGGALGGVQTGFLQTLYQLG